MNISIAVIEGPLHPRSTETAEIFRNAFARVLFASCGTPVGKHLRARTTLEIWIKYRANLQAAGFYLLWPDEKQQIDSDLARLLMPIGKVDDLSTP